MKRRLVIASLSLLPALARAHSYRADAIKIGHAWALPSKLADGQAFMPLLNTGKEADALVAARSSACATIELRRNARYDDPPEREFALEPGKPLPMRPAARHLRLAGLRAPLEPGGRFSLILDFSLAGEAEIDVVVEASPAD